MGTRYSQNIKKSRQLIALVLAGFGIFLLIAQVTASPLDLTASEQNTISNWGGSLGAHLSSLLTDGFGKGAYLFPFLFILFAYPCFKTGTALTRLRQAGPICLLLISFLLILPADNPASPSLPGGTVGRLLSGQCVALVGTFGTYFSGTVLLLFSLLFLFREPLKKLHEVKKKMNKKKTERPEKRVKKKEKPEIFQGSRILFNNGQGKLLEEAPLDNSMIFKAGISRQELLKKFKEQALENGQPAPLFTKIVIEAALPAATPLKEPVPDTATALYENIADETAAEVVPIVDEQQWTQEQFYDPPSPPEPLIYHIPDSTLLAKSTNIMDEETKEQIHHNARLLEQTFQEFGIEAIVTNIRRGPVITRFEMSIPPGVKLNRVVTLQDNIALNLAAASVRIEAPIPGKSAIGIEVPNKKRSMVTLRDILESADFRDSKAVIPVALGQTVSGSPEVTDLASMPHLIIAGTTGSGKSVCVNGIICSLLFNMSPEQVRLILVDPKYVELAPYNGIPHLLIPVINKPRAAIMALRWLVKEMERRYQLLQLLSTRNITSFNQKIAAREPIPEQMAAEDYKKMPYLIVVIDELADLMILAKKEIEDSISRLAAMSRAVGIHLIFATQRPSVDVLTGVIKNNFPARIAFQVASSTDSRTILDSNGADKLLGKGDSLFVGPGSPFPIRVQGAFLSEEEVDKTTEYLRSLGEPEYEMQILETPAEEEENHAPGSEETDDPLFKEAVDIVLESKRASASYLQRRLKIGYNRAARMVELMEEEGIIGPQQGSKPRDILM